MVKTLKPIYLFMFLTQPVIACRGGGECSRTKSLAYFCAEARSVRCERLRCVEGDLCFFFVFTHWEFVGSREQLIKLDLLYQNSIQFTVLFEKKSLKITKMNRILMLAMLCVASASCLELENICASDAFKYKDVLVNAFYRVQWSVTFESLNHYLINDTVKCDPLEFKNKTNLQEALKFKDE